MIFKYGMSPIYFLVGICLVLSCGEEKVMEEIIRPVRYQMVYMTGGNRVRAFSGTAQAGMESNLSFKVAGTVQRIAVTIGDNVRMGQVLAVIDPEDYRLKVQQAEAALEQAKSQARYAADAYNRAMQLYENRTYSKSNLDAARAASEGANAAVSALEKQLELAKRQLNYTILRAPVNGSIAQVNCEVNENIQIGQTIFTLTSGSQIEVKISIPEVLISQIQERDITTVKFDAIPGKEFSATVTEVGVAATSMANTFPVTVRLDQSEPQIRPGMAAEVTFRFESDDKPERFIVPLASVGEDFHGRFVYVVIPFEENDNLGIIERRNVTIGDLTADGLEIFQGLLDGDRLVTAGVSRIKNGQKVKIL
jgi:multidrug efflux system membrane fusion protein